MSQGQTIKGKTTTGRNVEVQVDGEGRLVIAGVTLDPAGLATTTKQDEIIAAIEGITIPAPVGGATLAEQQAQTALLTTIEANQLPDSHNVTVDNQPTEFPLPAAQVTTLTPPAAITGFATQTTLASLLTELQAKADLSETQPVSLASVPSHAVTNAGTFATQASGNVAHDAADSGSPVKIGGKAYSSAPADVTANDRVNAYFDLKGRLKVDGSDVTQPVSAASLPLPTGAATSANQSTVIGHLDGVEGLLTTIDADTGAIAGAVSGSEMQTDTVSAVSATLDHGSNLDIDTTAEQITTTSFAAKFGVTVKSAVDNTDTVYIGNSDVTAGTTAGTDGFPLEPGESITLPVNNSNLLYAIGAAANQKVFWSAV